MTIEILVVLLIAISCVAAWFALQTQMLKRHEIDVTRKLVETLIPEISQPQPEKFEDVSIVDGTGAVVVTAQEFASIPSSVRKIQDSDPQLNRMGQCASELLSGTARLPGKTIRLVFKPEIARGLQDGTYTLMTTKAGENLADAVKVSENGVQTIVGKGRIVEGGKVAQFASGAFMLLSVAVSQAHLADIERSLGGIKKSLSELRAHIEDQDRAEILGSLDYLHDMIPHLQNLADPQMISAEKSHAIEALIRDSFKSLRLVQSDLDRLVDSIGSIESKDTFGTFNTYKEILAQVEKLGPLTARYEMYLQLSSVAGAIVRYLDPTGIKLSRPRAHSEDWLSSIDRFKSAVAGKTQSLIGHSYAASDEIVKYRADEVVRKADERMRIAHEICFNYRGLNMRLDGLMQNLISDSGTIDLAIRYDQQGQVQEAAFLT